MNALSPPRARVAIEVIFDFVCPWCFLGVRRLRRALRLRPDVLVEIGWRPFLLNPEAGVAGLLRQDQVPRRPGTEERTRRLHATLADLGRSEGIVFQFGALRRNAPSLDAHRMVAYAAREGRADEAVDALFEAYFSNGSNLGDQALLSDVGAGLGLHRPSLRRFLAGSEGVETVHAENLRAHRLGINGVPCFVVGGRHAIAGAQEPEVLERLLDVALAEGDRT